MKTVTIRVLHSRTGQVVRVASRHGEIRVTVGGRVIFPLSPVARSYRGQTAVRLHR